MRDRKHDAYGRPLADVADDVERPVMLLYDAPTNRQPQPCTLPFRFRREERLHHFWQIVRRDAHARVHEFYHHCLGTILQHACCGTDGRCDTLQHGIAGVCEQVEEQLPQQFTVGEHHRHVGCKLAHDADTAVAQVVMDEVQRVCDLLTHIHGGNLRLATAAELEQVCHQMAHPLDLLLDDLQGPPFGVMLWHLC